MKDGGHVASFQRNLDNQYQIGAMVREIEAGHPTATSATHGRETMIVHHLPLDHRRLVGQGIYPGRRLHQVRVGGHPDRAGL